MVNIQTNLLKNRQTLNEKDYQQERKLLRYSILGLIVTVIVIVSLSSWNLVLTSRMSKIEHQLLATTKEMQGLVQASAQQVYLKSRLKLVTGFLADRSLTRESLQKIFATSITGTHVTGVAFEEENIIEVEYTSENVQSLAKLLAYYQTDTDYFTQAVSKGIMRNKDQRYQMTLSLTLPKGGK